jgi:uncharacterized LabA/DUF88 family protein
VDRCAIFVDAGYLFAEGGKLCCGTRARRSLLLDAAGATDTLCQIANEGCGLPVLRTYWYDGAKGGVPTTAQQLVAALPNVKLRLGRLNARMEQKGVDALIYRDLMTLARERAISDAYLLSGDEDLREGVRSAQDMGVRVTLIGIAPSGQEFNQSRDLIYEADEVRTLARRDLAKVLTARNSPPSGASISLADPLSETRLAAKTFAHRWAAKASATELANLHAGHPSIPHLLDLDLVQQIEHHLGGTLRGNDLLRRAARKTFWENIPPAPVLSTVV